MRPLYILLAIAVIVTIAPIVYFSTATTSQLSFEENDRGVCMVGKKMACKSLNLATIEKFGDLQLPEQVSIKASGSNQGTMTAESWAVLEVPSSEFLPGETMVRSAPGNWDTVRWIGEDRIRDAGIIDITATYRDGQLSVVEGTGASGETLLYVLQTY